MSVEVPANPGLQGRSLIAGSVAAEVGGSVFHAYDPRDGRPLETSFYSASIADVDRAVVAATDAYATIAATTGQERARLLRAIADGIDASGEVLIEQAHRETALPRPRLTGEVARTSGQLRLFASVVEEGSWVMARIDTADPARTPPKPDVRSMLRPLGPVAIFGASNFPLAFSVAGGDTASALAAGNPVVVKAHPAHPGTSELMGRVVVAAIQASGLPAGLFSLLFDGGHEVGSALVQHPGIRAVGFTGSFRGGRALMDLAAARPDPIPVYAEMGSTNPVFVLPGALQERGAQLAEGLHGSFTLGGGQFCTKPGVVFLPKAEAAAFVERLRGATEGGVAFPMLTGAIASAYKKALTHRETLRTASGATGDGGFSVQPILLETTGAEFFANPSLAEEVFGPTTLVVHCDDFEGMLRAAQSLQGHLTATILGTEKDLEENAELLQVLESKVGRVIFNGFPTGVEVCHAMVHGGPYPATSDGRSTSVGSQAIFRFARPVAYQGLPESALPDALRSANPLKILRLWNGAWSSEAKD
ncbi:MAG TPA: aldehyde dehydrogenase (NADP(+)) [Acidobacteriaceae bacterium]|nr:aldehyde dehydrogenase (NADP(+)) [Acidobacteriaceae bacterium]